MRCRMLMLAGLAAGLMGFGCAKRSGDIAATYVSPPNYNQLNCRQLAEEAALVSERAFNLRGERDDSKHTWEIVPPSGAPVVFWPTAFMVNDPAPDGRIHKVERRVRCHPANFGEEGVLY